MLNTFSRTRSEVGRVSSPFGAWIVWLVAHHPSNLAPYRDDLAIYSRGVAVSRL